MFTGENISEWYCELGYVIAVRFFKAGAVPLKLPFAERLGDGLPMLG